MGAPGLSCDECAPRVLAPPRSSVSQLSTAAPRLISSTSTRYRRLLPHTVVHTRRTDALVQKCARALTAKHRLADTAAGAGAAAKRALHENATLGLSMMLCWQPGCQVHSHVPLMAQCKEVARALTVPSDDLVSIAGCLACRRNQPCSPTWHHLYMVNEIWSLRPLPSKHCIWWLHSLGM